MSRANGPSVGWIVQPALFDDPPGIPAADPRIARELIAANERHVAIAIEGGFDTIWVEDHMGWGAKAHLECFTNMAWLAGRHPGPRYGTMVCGQAFRNPAYLAKLAGNMQLLTDGRFILGIGAGNNPGEHREFGYPFPDAPERLAQTEEAIRVIRACWSEIPATFHGTHYTAEGATVAPLPEPRVPLMVGGGGERVTLRLVAEYGDWWCSDIGPVDVFERKSGVTATTAIAWGVTSTRSSAPRSCGSASPPGPRTRGASPDSTPSRVTWPP